MGNTYTIECEQGHPLSVTSAVAGSTISCECGAEVKVPGLSQLRLLSGKEAYVSNAIEMITSAHQAGREPAGLECLRCSQLAGNVIDTKILCERSEMDFNSLKWLLLPWLPVLVYGLIQSRKRNKELEETSTRNVRTHFRLCQRCLRNPRRPPNRRKIRRLLKKVPVYAQLYKENPEAYTKFLQVRTADPETPVGLAQIDD